MSLFSRITASLFTAMATLATPVNAQRVGGLEVGAFGRYVAEWPSSYGASTAESGDRSGYGARIGLGLTKYLALEVEGSETSGRVNSGTRFCQTSVLCDFDAQSFHARGLFHFRILGSLEALLGAGGTRHNLRGAIGTDSWGAHGLAGLRLPLSKHLSLRAEILHERISNGPSGRSGGTTAIQAGVSVGFSKGCHSGDDYLAVGPVDSRISVGEEIVLVGEAETCAKEDRVKYTLRGAGDLHAESGRFKATEPGVAIVLATSARGGLSTEIRITVDDPAPPLALAREETESAPALVAKALPVEAREDTMPKFVFNVKGVFFRFDDSRLNQAGMDTLRIAARALRERPRVNVEVVGHTDHTGPAAYNMKLSRNRAITVTTFLIGEGVLSERIETSWKGETEPIADNNTLEGRRLNRRVVIRQTN